MVPPAGSRKVRPTATPPYSGARYRLAAEVVHHASEGVHGSFEDSAGIDVAHDHARPVAGDRNQSFGHGVQGDAGGAVAAVARPLHRARPDADLSEQVVDVDVRLG